jgi:hypothetical protein
MCNGAVVQRYSACSDAVMRYNHSVMGTYTVNVEDGHHISKRDTYRGSDFNAPYRHRRGELNGGRVGQTADN